MEEKKLGYKMKCENCLYGCVVIENSKVKRIFCGRFQKDILLVKYRRMRNCLFFRKDDKKCF